MPSAICKECDSLIHWPYGQYIKMQTCNCGCKKLIYVKGTYDSDKNSWVYRDRKGNIKKNVPRDTHHKNFE